jgi:hypothetical protein
MEASCRVIVGALHPAVVERQLARPLGLDRAEDHVVHHLDHRVTAGQHPVLVEPLEDRSCSARRIELLADLVHLLSCWSAPGCSAS